MSGCTTFFYGLSQLAYSAAVGGASMCSDGRAVLAETRHPQRFLYPLRSTQSAGPSPDGDLAILASHEVWSGPQEKVGSDLKPLAVGNAGKPDLAPATLLDEVGPASIRKMPGAEIREDPAPSQDKPRSVFTPDMFVSRGGLVVSGGFASSLGPNLNATLTRRNIGGLDHDIAASARYSKYQTLFSVAYTDRNFLGTNTGFSTTLFASRLSTFGVLAGSSSSPFRETSRGLDVRFSRKLADGFTAAANYRFSADSFGITGTGGVCDTSIFGGPVCGAIGRRTSSVVGYALTFDRRDIDAGALRSLKLRLSQDLAGLGGTTRYIRTRVSGSVTMGIGSRLTLSLEAEAGMMTSLNKRNIPLPERFYIGASAMRGFDLRSFGPKVQPTGAGISQSAGVAVGGRAYYAARVEVSAPLGGSLDANGVRVCAFIDAGSVFNAPTADLLPGETLIGNSSRPRVSAGVGLAIGTPVGRFRLNFAQPVMKQVGDRPKSFSISFEAAI